jgi:ligand-binding sensor domain-containing protein
VGRKVRQVLVSPASTATRVKAWAATNEGLAELTLSVEEPFEPAIAQVSIQLHVPPAIAGDDVLSLAVSPEGRVFAGTSRGFSALGEEGPALKAAPWSLPSETVQALLFERRGTGAAARDVLWAGTSSGLIRYDVTLDIATRFGVEEGLPADDVRSLAWAPDGKTRYLGTTRGLASYAGP